MIFSHDATLAAVRTTSSGSWTAMCRATQRRTVPCSSNESVESSTMTSQPETSREERYSAKGRRSKPHDADEIETTYVQRRSDFLFGRMTVLERARGVPAECRRQNAERRGCLLVSALLILHSGRR